MLEQVMEYCNNYFYKAKEVGRFSIVSGRISNRGVFKAGQYVRIIGSDFNDGVYKIESLTDGKINIASLEDEMFEGAIVALAVPKSFLSIVKDIEAFESSASSGISPYISESFENYSYTRATKDGKPLSWVDLYGDRLSQYRKMSDGLRFVKPVQLQTVVTSASGGVLMTDDNEGIEVVK